MSPVVAIVQARMGSTRFPGKMLANLGEFTVLEWVLKRVSAAQLVDAVVLATTSLNNDDALVKLAKKLGVHVFRGCETDVLGRFAAAALHYQADIVVRVCADNPFIDPDEIDRLITYFKANQCDYACNHQSRLGSRCADGFGAEILSSDLLQKIAFDANSELHREHVTLYLWDYSSQFRLHALPVLPDLSFPELRFDVDSLADLKNLEILVEAGVNIKTSAIDIVRISQMVYQLTNADLGIKKKCDNVIDEFDSFLKRLFPLCRSITGNPNRETLKILKEIVPLSIHEVPTGTKVYDWTIPEEWSIHDAWIADATGRRIVDYRVNNLHVVSYSQPINSVLDWVELSSHLHRHPELKDAIPYRTSYYNRSWGFCVTDAQYQELQATSGPFTVVIDSALMPGSLTYGEYIIPGYSTKEILISCYICHPSMANDSLSGVILTAFLARYITAIERRHWTYRIVFVPETIGAIAYSALNESFMKDIDFGLVITTAGGPGKFGYKQSYDSGHYINTLIEKVLGDVEPLFITYPFDIHGSDERQYSSQGFMINVATICKDRYYEYPYYHSSLDNLDFVTSQQLFESFEVYKTLIENFEMLKVYRNTTPNCEVMLSRHGLYPKHGGAIRPDENAKSELDIILWLLHYCNGRKPLQQIALLLDIKLESLNPIIDKLVNNSLLKEV